MGDHAASVAKQARKLAPEPPLKRYMDLPDDGRAGRGAGARRAAGAGRSRRRPRRARWRRRDDDMDDLYHAHLRRDARADARRPGQRRARHARDLFAAHYLERIGDRVTNIAEDVVFLATGDIEDLNP